MEYPGYPEEFLEENLLVVLDGTTSLGVSLRSRFGGKGCYVEGFANDDTLHEDNLRSRSTVKIGDILVSINGDSVHECTVEEIHRKVQLLSFPIRLHFQRNNLPTLHEVEQDISSIRILCYYSWVKRFIKKLPYDINPNLDYHSVLAMWSRLFQVTIWLKTIFIEEHIFSSCTQEHLNRIAHALIIVFPFSVTDNVPLQEYYAFLRNTMMSYLQSAPVQDFLNNLIDSFFQSDEFRRMMAFNPSFNDWQFISITDLLQSSAGLLTLCSVVPKSALWIQMYSAYHSLQDPNTLINEKEADFLPEGDSLALEVTITLIEQGILRRIYESDAYFLYLRHVTSSKTRFFRELFPLLPRSFSLHHYEHGQNTMKTDTNTCSSSSITIKSTVQLEFNVLFNHFTQAKDFQLVHFSVIDCGDNDYGNSVNSWWHQTLGIEARGETRANTNKEENPLSSTNRTVRYLCPQLESNLLSFISCKNTSLKKAPVGLVLHQFPQNLSTGSTPLYVASMAFVSDNLSHTNKINDILHSLCAVDASLDATLNDEPSALTSSKNFALSTTNRSLEIPSLHNMRHEGSKMINEMYVFSSRWLQPVRSVVFPAVGEKNSPRIDDHSFISSMDIVQRKSMTKEHPDNATTVVKEGKTLKDDSLVEDKSTMKGMMLTMTSKLWGKFHRNSSDTSQARCEEDSHQNAIASVLEPTSISEKVESERDNNYSSELIGQKISLIARETTSLTTDETTTHNDDTNNDFFCDDDNKYDNNDVNNNDKDNNVVGHIIAKNDDNNEENSDAANSKPPTTAIASVRCLISTEPKLRTLRKSLLGVPLLPKDPLNGNQATNNGGDLDKNINYNKEDEWCFDMITEQIAPGVVFLLFHAFLLEVSVVMVYNDESSLDNTADILPVLLTQWLSRAVAPLQWPHTIAVNAPSEIVLPLLQCPTPVWLALPRSVYQFHVHSSEMNNVTIHNDKLTHNKTCNNTGSVLCEEKRELLLPQENIIVVDLSRQEVYWPSSLYETFSMTMNSSDDVHLQSNVENKDPSKKANKKKEGCKEYLALFRLARSINCNTKDDKNSRIMSNRFKFSPLFDATTSTVHYPMFFIAWCRCFAPASSSYASYNRPQDRLSLSQYSQCHDYHHDTKDKSNLFETVTHAIPVAWTTLPDHCLAFNAAFKNGNEFGGFSQKMHTLLGLCRLFVQQLLYGMNYLLLDVPISQADKNNIGLNGIEEGCLCLDDELFLWVKTQQALVHRSSISTARDEKPMCLFAHEFYLRVFLKRWLRSQALSVYLTAKHSQ